MGEKVICDDHSVMLESIRHSYRLITIVGLGMMPFRLAIESLSGTDSLSSSLFSPCINPRETWLRISERHSFNHLTNSFPSPFDVILVFLGPHQVEQVERFFRTVRTASFQARYLVA